MGWPTHNAPTRSGHLNVRLDVECRRSYGIPWAIWPPALLAELLKHPRKRLSGGSLERRTAGCMYGVRTRVGLPSSLIIGDESFERQQLCVEDVSHIHAW